MFVVPGLRALIASPLRKHFNFYFLVTPRRRDIKNRFESARDLITKCNNQKWPIQVHTRDRFI